MAIWWLLQHQSRSLDVAELLETVAAGICRYLVTVKAAELAEGSYIILKFQVGHQRPSVLKMKSQQTYPLIFCVCTFLLMLNDLFHIEPVRISLSVFLQGVTSHNPARSLSLSFSLFWSLEKMLRGERHKPAYSAVGGVGNRQQRPSRLTEWE